MRTICGGCDRAHEDAAIEPVVGACGSMEPRRASQVWPLPARTRSVGNAAIANDYHGAVFGADRIVGVDFGDAIGSIQLPIGAARQHLARQATAVEAAADYRYVPAGTAVARPDLYGWRDICSYGQDEL